MELKESGEMYLETIYILSQELDNVRSLDVARYMKFSKPSVSRAMGLLRNSRYIAVDEKGYISLTNSGLEIAEKIYERHIVLTKLLTDQGSPSQAGPEGQVQEVIPS